MDETDFKQAIMNLWCCGNCKHADFHINGCYLSEYKYEINPCAVCEKWEYDRLSIGGRINIDKIKR